MTLALSAFSSWALSQYHGDHPYLISKWIYDYRATAHKIPQVEWKKAAYQQI